jgi:hypothetical protein
MERAYHFGEEEVLWGLGKVTEVKKCVTTRFEEKDV